MDGRPLVALQVPPGPAFLGHIEREWARGHAVLPLAADLPEPRLRVLLSTLRPHAHATATGRSVLPGGVAAAEGVDLVIATSGSTGVPKGVELSRAALEASAGASLRRLGGGPGDRWLCCLPVDHAGGLQVLLRASMLGVAPIVHPRFDVTAIAAETAATHVSLVSTMLARLLDADVDVARFRAILLGGAATPAPLLQRAAAAGANVVTTYGMTETGGGCVYDGLPLEGVQAAVGDDGRIRLRGPVLLTGYRLRPDLTAAALDDGWFVTGDLGRFDGGRLQVAGRADAVIVTGGVNVSSDEVTALVERCRGVAEAAVVGRPDAEWGERVVAVVIADGDAPTLAEVRDAVRRRAPAAFAPRELRVVGALPRLPSGKVDRPTLLSVPAERVELLDAR